MGRIPRRTFLLGSLAAGGAVALGWVPDVSYPTTVKAESIRAQAAEKALSDRVAKLEAAATPGPAPSPVPLPTPTPGPATGYPPDGQLSSAPTPAMPMPEYLKPVVVDGIRITRISNIAGVRQAYSRHQVENKDRSKIALAFTGAGVSGRMLDGATYADLGSFHFAPMALWSNTDRNKLIACRDNTLVAQDATTAVETTIKTFAGYALRNPSGDPGISIGDWEGGISDDDQWIALIGWTGSAFNIVVYNLVTGQTFTTPAPAGLDNVQISRKGGYVIAVGGGYTRCYDRTLSGYLTLYGNGYHGDNALDASGAEIYVANNANGVRAFKLSDGSSIQLLPDKTAFEYGHVGGHGDRVVLSVYDPSTMAGRPGNDQLVEVRTDGSGLVAPFGFAHHSIVNYGNEPHATPSRDGKRIYFASEWGGSGVYGFVAEAAAA
jgi:hypothetical protein